MKFYTDTPHRVFPRSKGVIGREVRNCHPPKSVHLVEEIIEKFRNGEQSRAEFWINKPGLFIYITYIAVRDADGRFRGVLEMMQDCTHIRSLEGSQTLLTWGSGKQNTTGLAEARAAEHDGSDGAAKIGDDGQTAPAAEKSSVLLPLKAETKLSDLLAAYPKLKADLPSINAAFKMLQTPLGRIMIPKATVAIMSERSQMPQNELIAALEKKILEYESGREK